MGDHVVGDALEHLVALLHRQLARLDREPEQDLQVDLVVGAVDAGRVVDRVGVDAAAAQRVLDAAALGEAEVAALADDLRAQLAAVDADGVVGAVADVGVRLRRRLDVGADAAVPEQVDRRAQDRPGSARSASAARPRSRARRAASGDSGTDFADARPDAAAGRDQRCGRSRPTTTPAARTAARARRTTASASGSGSMKTWRWSNAATSRIWCDSSMPLPNTSPDMSPMPTRGERLGHHVAAQLAEVPLDALPRAPGGDPERLVVVAVRAAGRVRVAEPEAVLGADGVGGVGQVGGALVGGDDQVGSRAVQHAHVRAGARPRRRPCCRSGRACPASG